MVFIPFNVYAFTLPDLYSENVLIYDPELNRILYEENAREVKHIASLTKIMTTIVAIENIKDLDETITITNTMLSEIPSDASVAGLRVGDVVTYRDLLYASMLPSGADATTALAYGISGSTAKYVELMNKKAQELNLKNTHFVNVTGLDTDGHYSTAEDVLTFLLYALNNKLFKQIYTTRTYTLSNGLLVLSTISHYGDYGYDLTHIIGSKTGFEEIAGLCMSAIIKVNGKELILVTLGAEKNAKRTTHIEDTLTIIDYLEENYKEQVLYKKGTILKTLPVTNGNIKSYDIVADEDISIYTVDKLDKDDYYYEYEGLEKLSFKNNEGDKIGTIKYHYLDDTIISNVYLEENIHFSLINFIISNPLNLIPFIIVIILFLCLLKSQNKKKKRRRKKI